MSNVGIAGTGAYVPSLAVTNDDISELVETNDEWIMKRTGIRERRISQGEDTSGLRIITLLIDGDRNELSNLLDTSFEIIIDD